jgi:predicted PurR-regulated permease PerM
MPVPPLLADLAGWAWRLVVVGFVVVVVVRALARLHLVTLPLIAALLLTAGLRPAVVALRNRGLGRGLATAIVLGGAVALLALALWFVADRAAAQYTALVDQLADAVRRVTSSLHNGPLHLSSGRVTNLGDQLTRFLSEHRSRVASGVVTGVKVAGDVVIGLVVTLFATFFFLYDGDRIWQFLLRPLPVTGRTRAHDAAGEAWDRIAGFIRGTFVIAVVHGTVVAVTLAIMGVPLVAPLALLVFVGSFVPIVGAIVFGGVAALVVLATKGWVLALVFVGVLTVDDQIEAHVLQPFLVGRYVRLHPLAVIVAITTGGIVAGIVGAILAVPTVASVDAIVRSLSATRPPEPPPRARDVRHGTVT